MNIGLLKLQKAVILSLSFFHLILTSSICIAATALPGQAPGLTPQMGWNSWNHFGCSGINETVIKAQADAMVSSGMTAVGYQYINIDDCWQIGRDATGTIIADPVKFPSGMAALANYIHQKGLKFGLYTDRGTATCAGRPGSFGYEVQDAATYASWEVDYIKEDNCNVPANAPSAEAAYALMASAMVNTGRPMVLSICIWGQDNVWDWGASFANLWRTTGDISDNWDSMLANFDENQAFAPSSGPGGWNDPDMLEIGNGGMTTTEYTSHMSLWSIAAAPLIAGNDLSTMTATTQAILTNAEVIAVDQDPAGIQGGLVYDSGTGIQVYSKPLMSSPRAPFNGQRAVLLINRGATPANITANWKDIGLGNNSATVRDLWNHVNLGSYSTSYTAMNVPSHGSVMLKVSGTESIPSGTNYLGDLVFAYQTVGWGRKVHIDQSIGGNPIKLNGIIYPKGLGAHAQSDFRFNLAGQCSAFSADVGVDDEMGTLGSVVFQVWADGAKLYDSGIMNGGSPHQSINVNITGKNTLKLIVTDGGDGNTCDHADWANAQLVCSGGATQYYEAESPNNTIIPPANIYPCTACSGGLKVGYIGNSSTGGSITFNGINVSKSGNYTLVLYYVDGSTPPGGRTMFMSINNQPAISFTTPGNGSWNSPQSLNLPIVLTAGNNTIKFFNNTAYAADIDRIAIKGANLVSSARTPKSA